MLFLWCGFFDRGKSWYVLVIRGAHGFFDRGEAFLIVVWCPPGHRRGGIRGMRKGRFFGSHSPSVKNPAPYPMGGSNLQGFFEWIYPEAAPIEKIHQTGGGILAWH
jgi:hypothetical protein